MSRQRESEQSSESSIDERDLLYTYIEISKLYSEVTSIYGYNQFSKAVKLGNCFLASLETDNKQLRLMTALDAIEAYNSAILSTEKGPEQITDTDVALAIKGFRYVSDYIITSLKEEVRIARE
jgi:hypothetical protein